IGVTGDDGSAFGGPGLLQGDSRFGDLRVAARPLSANVYAIATPFDLLNTWSGEILVNSTQQFSKGDPAGVDLFSVLLQEAGHALVNADLTTRRDVDVYKVNLANGTRDFTVALRTSGISLLTARVTVYDSTGRMLASAASTDPQNGDVTLFIPGDGKLKTCYV